MRPTFPDTKRSALLVIDMQEYFRGIAEPVLADISRVIERNRGSSIPVIYTQHGHKNPERDAGMLGQWWGDLILSESPEWAILPEIAPLEAEKVLDKTRYSAFYGTELEDYLRALGVTDLVISGVMTNLCCETTARDAFVRDFRVFFLSDGTATVSTEMHEATLVNLACGFATILTCQELCEGLG